MNKRYFKGIMAIAMIAVLALLSVTSGCAPAPSKVDRVTAADMSNSALLIVHMQNDVVKEGGFVDYLIKEGVSAPHLDGIQAIIPNISKIATAMRADGRPVVIGNVAVKEADYSDSLYPYWKVPKVTERPFFVEGTWGADTVEELAPQGDDYLVIGRSWNVFYGTELDELLRKLGVNTVIITGVHTDACALFTAAGAVERGYYVIYVIDGMAALDENAHICGLGSLGKAIGEGKTTNQVIKMLE